MDLGPYNRTEHTKRASRHPQSREQRTTDLLVPGEPEVALRFGVWVSMPYTTPLFYPNKPPPLAVSQQPRLRRSIAVAGAFADARCGVRSLAWSLPVEGFAERARGRVRRGFYACLVRWLTGRPALLSRAPRRRRDVRAGRGLRGTRAGRRWCRAAAAEASPAARRAAPQLRPEDGPYRNEARRVTRRSLE